MNKNTITLDKKACCLPGFETFDTTKIAKRLRKKRYVKSIKELRYEQEERTSNKKNIGY